MKKVNKLFKGSNCSGLITLEACITVIMFLFVMLFLCGLYVVYMAQSKVADTALKTVQSLSFETYYINKLHLSGNLTENGSIQSSIGYLVSRIFTGKDSAHPDSFSYSQQYFSDNLWWKGSQTSIGEVVKKRFIGYLSGGDENLANKILKGLNIDNGIDGLDFSQSYVEGEELHIVINYTIEYPFDIADLGKRQTTETVCSRLWLDGV
ncbi:MAG: hypothetical protein MJ172_08045 [Clostridia bacterium]|nr:hypothetical protein [Clostridia bacterium]